MQWPLLLGTWGYHLPGCKDPYIPAPGVTSASNSGPFVAGRARIDPCSAPPPVTGVKVSPVPSLGESNVTGPTRSVWSTTQPQGPVRGLLVAHYVVHQSNARFGWAWGLTGEISGSASLTQLSLDRGTVLHTVLGEPDTGMQAAASLRALQPPPSGMKPPRVITPQGPHPTPVRPPVLRTPLPVSYLEEEPLERLVLGRGMCPPIPRAKLSHPVCLKEVDSGMLWERVMCPLDVCRRTNRLTQGHVSVAAPLNNGPDPPVSLGGRPTHKPPNRQCRLVGSLAIGSNFGGVTLGGGAWVPE